jgi:thioester reductase-like protein
VHCLLRAPDEAAAERRADQALAATSASGTGERTFRERLVPHAGDLADRHLGLGEAAFRRLASTIEVVIHAGAQVHYLEPYERLRPANVLGTHHVIRFAAEGRPKRLVHLSTARVFGADCAGTIPEAIEPPPSAQLLDGYQQTKWVAERAAWNARKAGLPATIFRSGPLQGDTVLGAYNPVGFSTLLVQACAALGCAPEGDYRLELTPVDLACQGMVHVALSPAPPAAAYHFRNPAAVDAGRFWAAFRARGLRVERVPASRWLAAVAARFPAMHLWFDGGFERYFELSFDAAHGDAALAGAGVSFPAEEALLDLYVRAWLRGAGSPRTPAEGS